MQVETALFFETVEQIYERVFRALKPRTTVPRIVIQFRKYANANSRIRLQENELRVSVSDLLESAPAPIQEALAYILISKLYRKAPPANAAARYRRYLNRADVRRTLYLAQKARGRKAYADPRGRVYDLRVIFEELNFEYFYGLMARPELGWSLRPSRTTLGHYDSSHHVIVLTNLFDSEKISELLLKYVMFHEMLHLRYPTEQHGARRSIHTKEFEQAEKAFRGYKTALAEMQRFVNGAGRQACG